MYNKVIVYKLWKMAHFVCTDEMGDLLLESREFAAFAAGILDDRKAENIEVLKISELTTIADYFVICNGNSSTQVKALCDNVTEKTSEMGIEPLRIEGYDSAAWILVDYGSVVVHIFKTDMRDFYSLDRLWGDGEKVTL